MDIQNIIFDVSIWVVPILLAVPLHEAAHGWVAHKLGDDTAFNAGRVTFNPFKHIDLFGTIILPAVLLFGSGGTMAFGYAKPVPVNFAALKRWRLDTILVAVAGPASNLFLAVASVILFHVVFWLPESIREWVALTKGLFFPKATIVRMSCLLCSKPATWSRCAGRGSFLRRCATTRPTCWSA